MVEANAVRDTVLVWARRCAVYFLGAAGATGMLVLLIGAVLVASGVLEW